MATEIDKKDYLSTGQVAKFLSVTPDTVLKWIKKGKIPAVRTAGGHYRVHRNSLGCLLATRADLQRTDRQREPVYCWEYHSQDGTIKDECVQCLVYRARAKRCFEMSNLSREEGFSGTFCKSTCEECDYFQFHRNDPVRLLVISDSINLREELTTEVDSSRFQLEFASREYDASALVESFRPEWIVIDCTSPRVGWEELSRQLASDPRIPGATIVLAGTGGARGPVELIKKPIVEIEYPFRLSDIEEHVEGRGSTITTEEERARAG